MKGDPRDARAVYGHGVVKQRRGDVSGGALDINAAKLLQADIVEGMARVGVSPPENLPSVPQENPGPRLDYIVAVLVALAAAAGLVCWLRSKRASVASRDPESPP